MQYCLYVRPDESSKEIAKYIEEHIIGTKNNENPEIVIAVGGDGTILQAFHMFPKAIILGLHTGHLGFFANYNPSTVDDLIKDVNEGSYTTETLELLTCKIYLDDGQILSFDALNEVTLISTLKTLIMDVRVDDEYLETFRGTGLCVSTTSGSTAYNKSLYGAVVDHSLEVMQLAEIASINSNAYRTLGSPLVLSSKRRITLESSTPLVLNVTVDHLSYTYHNFMKVELFYGGKTMSMGHHTTEGFIKRIARTFIDSK